jgi:Uma2 family endonuclease
MAGREVAMGVPPRKETGFTIKDWKTWEGRWELIGGEAFDMTPAPSLEHQRISSGLHINLGIVLREAKRKAGSGSCEVFAAPVDLFLGADIFQPDLAVVCDDAKKSERGIEGAPDLVVEILSPRTATRDFTRKRWAYEAAGVPEYLIVDPEERVALLLRLVEGKYQETLRANWGDTLALLGEQIAIVLE